MRILKKLLMWTAVLTVLLGVSIANVGVSEASSKKTVTKKTLKSPCFKRPVFSSPDKDNVYFEGEKIRIKVNYGETDLRVTANMTVVDKSMSKKTPLLDNSNGTYSLTSLPLSGETMVLGEKVAISFTALDPAGHLSQINSTYLVSVRFSDSPRGGLLSAPKLSLKAGDGQVQIFWSKVIGAKDYVISYKDVNNQKRQIVVPAKYSDAIVRNLQNGHQYKFTVAGRDINKKLGKSSVISGTPIKKAASVIVEPQQQAQPQVAGVSVSNSTSVQPAPKVKKTVPKIASGKSIVKEEKKEEVKGAATQEVKPEVKNTENSKKKDWTRLLLAISILIIAAGAALGGYYGYEWWVAKKVDTASNHKNKDRW